MSMSASLTDTVGTTKTEVTFIEPTYKRAVIVWWAILWRTMLWSLLAGLLMALVEVSLVSVDKLDGTWCLATSTTASLLAGIYVIRGVLRKKFRGFSIRLVAD